MAGQAWPWRQSTAAPRAGRIATRRDPSSAASARPSQCAWPEHPRRARLQDADARHATPHKIKRRPTAKRPGEHCIHRLRRRRAVLCGFVVFDMLARRCPEPYIRSRPGKQRPFQSVTEAVAGLSPHEFFSFWERNSGGERERRWHDRAPDSSATSKPPSIRNDPIGMCHPCHKKSAAGQRLDGRCPWVGRVQSLRPPRL